MLIFNGYRSVVHYYIQWQSLSKLLYTQPDITMNFILLIFKWKQVVANSFLSPKILMIYYHNFFLPSLI